MVKKESLIYKKVCECIEKEYREIHRRYVAGESIMSLAKEYKISEPTIYATFRKYGLELESGRKKIKQSERKGKRKISLIKRARRERNQEIGKRLFPEMVIFGGEGVKNVQY